MLKEVPEGKTQFDLLKEEFPKEKISWRASHMNGDGTSALALAYIDARDTMNRLDEVFGPENWKDSYHVVGATTMCTLEIKIEDEWVSKTDGAGVSDIEAEKGAISDAFKRAGVKWGIGRYLYDLKSPWVPCESYEKGGKKMFKKFTADPWEIMDGKPAPRTKKVIADESSALEQSEKWVDGADETKLREALEKLNSDPNPKLTKEEVKKLIYKIEVKLGIDPDLHF